MVDWLIGLVGWLDWLGLMVDSAYCPSTAHRTPTVTGPHCRCAVSFCTWKSYWKRYRTRMIALVKFLEDQTKSRNTWGKNAQPCGDFPDRMGSKRSTSSLKKTTGFYSLHCTGWLDQSLNRPLVGCSLKKQLSTTHWLNQPLVGSSLKQ